MKTIIAKYRDLFVQLFKYGIVGVINTIITAIVIFLLMNTMGAPYTISNIIGYIAGVINGFFLNFKWTFKTSTLPAYRQFIRFITVFLICFLIQFILVIVMVEYLSINENIAQLVGMVIYSFIGFLLNKYFTFKAS